MTRQRRAGGAVDRLPSGRYRVRVLGPDGRRISLGTFATLTAAENAYARARVEQVDGTWTDPNLTGVTVAEYANRWLDSRLTVPGEPLRPRVIEMYRGQLDRHILPTVGAIPCDKLSTATIRAWVATMRGPEGPGVSTSAKCYRLLRSIMATAVDDGLARRNPCNVKGAGVEPREERPIPTIDQVRRAADVIDPRFRTAVLLAAFVGLRRGELLGLQRGDIDLDTQAIRIVRQRQMDKQGLNIIGPPKTAAGKRTITIPAALIEDLRHHLATYAQPGPEGFVFTGERGGLVAPARLYTAWTKARREVEIEHIRFHDLRHLAGTLAASTGAGTKELMYRLGHSSPQAALGYQHATQERDVAIAGAIDAMLSEPLTRPSDESQEARES